MIDHQNLTTALLAKLEAELPLAATITPYLADALRKQSPETSIPKTCQVTSAFNSGDEGGILCELALAGHESGEQVFLASITHLGFDARHRLTREIAAYQKRRIKKLRRQNA